MLTQQTVSLLWCPSCRNGGLISDCTEQGERLIDGVLTCESCEARFPVEAGIPHLKSIDPVPEEKWNTWRGHLDGFAARRTIRAGTPNKLRAQRWRKKMQAFAEFLDVPDGRLLDVGCGPGNLRKHLDPSRVSYYGLDPLATEEAQEFPFVCALAESMPFRARTFSSLVVRSALDHFCDLSIFFAEATRVLVEEGHIFVEQAVHEVAGGGFVKTAVHLAKDRLDQMLTRKQSNSSPKHMREFSRESLAKAVEPFFEIERTQTYNANWYTASQIFMSLRCRSACRT